MVTDTGGGAVTAVVVALAVPGAVRADRLGNAAASDPRLVTREMQMIVTMPADGRERELVLSFSGSDYLITDGAAVTVTVTRPNVGRETGRQLPGPNAFPGE